ncbi:MAG: C4-dicarboxylate transport sensor protein DctB [bacterium ADurb.Bin431]|nr:MAG: C4-dicarboxylate transport sensor protein DctB [bacterium ADurb.Bin431]HNY92457.1 HAMP domain-containing sensor histidine kinase [bacterium]HOC24228.1 HAMP domain-containing sensor histidine kinase [bacterium]HOH07767.1 HAMP domain-containing sensor histidine kinase [bacterium]HOY43229.1 HAMP domain-containing sensor histidine kinase [bacterium]
MKERVQKFIVDRQLRLRHSFGDVLERTLGESLKSGQQLHRRLQALGLGDAAEALAEAVRHGRSAGGEKIFPSPLLALHWLAEPLVEGERIEGATIVLTDVTREKRQQHQQELGGRMEEVSTFAHKLASRLNNPLAAVLNGIGCLVLEEEPGPEWSRVRAELAELQEQVYAISRVTQALESFSREEGNSGKLVQLEAVLEKAVEVIQLLTAPRGVQISVSAGPVSSLIYANDILLEQCLLHLLRNAVEASPEGGEVIIRCGSSDGMAAVSISDSGAGIAAAEMKRIYEPFYSTKSTDHLGVGLPISYTIAARYKGFLELESVPGSGTTARLLFPVAKNMVKKG